jgi:pimeloyl-ACP methyl ester carboxylesterase
MKRQVLALALLAIGLLASTPVDKFNHPTPVFGSGGPAQPSPGRKVIFIQGIDSSGLPSPTNPDCQSQERNTQRLWNVICSLREVLHGVVLPEDIIWLSYKSGDQGYYDTENNTLPNDQWNDTCDGVATAAEELDRLIRKFPNTTFDIVGHSLGGLVAAYWVSGGAEDQQWLSENPPFLKNSIHSIITLDSPLNDTERGFFRVTRCGVPFEDKEDVLALEPLPGAIILECKPHPDPDTEQSWADLTGCDPAVTNKITDADATGSIIVTRFVDI